ncbi:tyrosine-type recombinase/integrase [Marinactinospora thermotolerans]|uniref:tyrosine-type recombinase/integrase n=1 Tax=Marinactinospora thermotolerans TaxID=531310 RepID=UPI003D92E562
MSDALAPLFNHAEVPVVDLVKMEVVHERIAQVAAHIRARSRRPNTEAAYAQDLDHWLRYCRIAGLDPDTVSADALTVFVAWLCANPGLGARHAAPATLERRVQGVVAHWHSLGRSCPRNLTRDAREAIRAHAQHLAEQDLEAEVGRGQAPLLTISGLRQIVQACPDTHAGLRDRALLLIGFGIAARRSELAGLSTTDISVDYDGGQLRGLRVRVRTSKTGQGRTVPIAKGTSPLTCPAIAWLRWSQAAHLTYGPALRRVDRHDVVSKTGLLPAGVGEVIRRAGQRTGNPDLQRLTGHSLRAGFATAARRAGHDVVAIARIGGWKVDSPELAKYLRIADEWDEKDNATVGIGL